MITRTGLSQAKAGSGFTLIELLLATAILLLLAGAMVLNFSVLQRGAGLEEGATQFEALLRFARAQSAITGRIVQLKFEESADLDGVTWFGNAHLSSEPDPLGQPGVFEDVLEVGPYLERINGLVRIESVTVLGSDPPEASQAASMTNQTDAAAGSAEATTPVRFYPDGSSDSAEFVLASLADDDQRRMAVRLEGVTGSIRREVWGSFDVKGQTNEEAQVEESPQRPAPKATSSSIPPAKALSSPETQKTPSEAGRERPGP